MNRIRLLAVAAAGAAVLLASSASAAPAGSGTEPLRTATVTGDMVQKVHWRRYRHCHRRYGRRRCHGGRRYYRYGVLPGVGIYIGRRHHHYRHHRWHRRRWR